MQSLIIRLIFILCIAGSTVSNSITGLTANHLLTSANSGPISSERLTSNAVSKNDSSSSGSGSETDSESG